MNGASVTGPSVNDLLSAQNWQPVPGAGTQTHTAILPTVALAPPSVEGGTNDTGTVQICTAAPAGGIVVAPESSNAAVAPVPAPVTIPAGLTTVGFQIATVSVSLETLVSITAVAESQSATATLDITPPVPTAVALAPNPVQGGAFSTGTVTISRPAPAAGFVVSLVSDIPEVASVPATVTVLEGTTTANFKVTTVDPVADTPVDISAPIDGTSPTGVLTVRH